MNDWPADPELDANLRRLVNTELAAARTDAVGLSSPRAVTHRRRDGRAVAGLGALAVIAIVASLVVRGTTTGGSPAPGAPGASGEAIANTSPTPTLTPTATPAPTRTPVPKVTAEPISSQSPSPWFIPTGSLNTKEDGPNSDAATLLADGRVLIVHGGDTAVEVYDPTTGKFSPTGSMTATRFGQTATLLQDGHVLVTGGYNCADADHAAVLASAEVYDPATGVFTPTGSMSTPREFQTATLLVDGHVLIAGGYNIKSALATAELYDPRTGKFTPTGSMNIPRDDHTATLLRDGRVLIVGGGGEATPSLTSAELYDPATGTFSQTGSMKSGRWLHTATLLQDGRVLIAGGRTSTDTVYANAEVYNPMTGKFSSTGSMNAGRQQHTATLLRDGRVLITGGYDGAGAAGQALASTELYDPKTGRFTANGSMGYPRMEQTATLLNDGRVLIAGGGYIGDTGGVGLASAVLYQP